MSVAVHSASPLRVWRPPRPRWRNKSRKGPPSFGRDGSPSRPKYRTKCGTPRRCVPTISSALLSQIQRGNLQQRGANLAVEVGMGSNGNDNTKLEEDICIHIF